MILHLLSLLYKEKEVLDYGKNKKEWFLINTLFNDMDKLRIDRNPIR